LETKLVVCLITGKKEKEKERQKERGWTNSTKWRL